MLPRIFKLFPTRNSILFEFSSQRKGSKISNLHSNIHNRIKQQSSKGASLKGKDAYKSLQVTEKTPLTEQQMRIQKQTENLQVSSQAVLNQEIIMNQILKQREIVDDSQAKFEKQKPFIVSFIEKLTIANTLGFAITNLPFISHHCFWLGAFSSTVLFPSFLVVACSIVGQNLSYLVLRQSLKMETPTSELKQISLTTSGYSTWIQMFILTGQIFSLATIVALPLLESMPQNTKMNLYYFMGALLFGSNLHSTTQQKKFKNINFHVYSPTICFMVFLAMCLFVTTFNKKPLETDNENFKTVQNDPMQTELQDFKKGVMWIRNVWKIQRNVIDEKAKITDVIVENQ